MIYERTNPGVIYEFTNDSELTADVDYASITAPAVVRCNVAIDGKIIETVFAGAGGSHSWWTAAGGKLLRHGLTPGSRLTVEVSGHAAFRIDWMGE